MRNTIPCTAGRIALLEPAMIQAIVEQRAFQRGHEYFKESRVRLLEADDRDIVATVLGNSGVYEQTIRLRDGSLVAACSCSLIEQPMCRHCVAVLLEFHRWSSQRGHRETTSPKGTGASQELRAARASSNGKSADAVDQDLRLSDLVAFVQWAQPAMKLLAKNESLPDTPSLPAGLATEWAETICALGRRNREQEDQQQTLHADLAQRELQIQQLHRQLDVMRKELQSARDASQRLEREVANYQGVIGTLKDLSEHLARSDSDVKAVAGDLSQSQGRLERLAQSFRDVSLALQDLAKQQRSAQPDDPATEQSNRS